MNVESFKLHSTSEKLVELLCNKTQNDNPMFFRVLVAYYLSVMASQMQTSITGLNKHPIPINMYAIALSPSGTGKGYATSFMEKAVINKFRDIFLSLTFPNHAQSNLKKLSLRRARRNGTYQGDELESLQKEFELIGTYLFSFDSATLPAVKQHRHKILLANSGSLNFQVDEIGANIISQTEVLHAFLELYDLGLIKDKLIKSTAENKRLERIEGATPTNMLLFGTPTKLLDGGRTEDLFFELLDMGYARRSLVSYTKHSKKLLDISAEDIVKNMFNNDSDDFIEQLSDEFALLASENNLHKKIHLPKNNLIQLVKYRLFCERKAQHITDHEIIKKTELEHRYFKALKLAGVYAFLEGNSEITQTNLENAIALVELSGKNFDQLMQPDTNYMKLAKYLSDVPNEVTLADLVENLPYFKGSKTQKDEMINLAIAYGYKNNIIIKKSIEDGILFLKGESLKETKLDELLISVSDDYAAGYEPTWVEWDDLKQLGEVKNFHWCNHAFEDNHRSDSTTISGFNLIVLDVDNGFPLKAAVEAFKGIKAMFYTTKSHKPNQLERYRVIIPTSHILHFNKEEYKQFINNICEQLPFDADTASNQRSKKWETNKGEVIYTDGDLFNVLPYIPQTKKNEDRINKLNEEDLDKLESWVINNTGDGNRNNQLYNYACILAEQKCSLADIRTKILSLNDKLPDSLEESEIVNTILKSVASKI